MPRSGGATPDRANTVEEVLLFQGPTEPDFVNVTVVVVAYRLAATYLRAAPALSGGECTAPRCSL